MTGPTASAGSEQILQCNLDRILFRTENPATGRAEVHKLLLRGSELEAEQEVALGRRLQALHVVRYLGAELDPVTRRPCVRMEFHAGTSLDRLVAQHGAFAAATACAILAPVARTLAAMHALRAPDLPLGVAHGDVKPANLLHDGQDTRLLDFEHAGPIGSGVAAGTPGFAGPEARRGAPLSAAFDVHALGATLHWLLCAQTPRAGALALQDPELQRLVAACLDPDPAARPAAAGLAASLAALAARLQLEGAEAVRQCLLAGDVERAASLLAAAAPSADAQRALLQRELRRRQRLLARWSRSAGAAGGPPTEDDAPADLTRRLRRWTAFLRRFPRHEAIARQRAGTRDLAGRLLAEALPRSNDFVREEQFAAARALLADLQELVRAAMAVPGPFQVPGAADVRMPSLLQRAPLQFLAQEEQRLVAAAAELDQFAAELEAAEGALALEAAEGVIDRIATRLGGTSAAVSRRRDRLHRLGFYVERIGRARGNVEQLRALVPDVDQGPLLSFVAECGRVAADSQRLEPSGSGAMGLRNLQVALTSLIDEFAALRPAAGPGLACLERALGEATDEAWLLVAEAQQKLQQAPVPVRPLQMLLGRLDTFRTLEALIDRPQRPRSTLNDRIESLRLHLEQAQATRDRLARGAEQALAKGHWTTGLFDMERAVTSLETEDAEGSREEDRLRRRLAEARKRKQEIDAAQRRNIELSGRLAELQDDPSCGAAERLQVLRERRDCLQFLAIHAPRDRGRLYARDLRDVESQVALELAAQAERQLDQTADQDQRLRLARETLAQLDTLAHTCEPGAELPARLAGALDQWRARLDAAQDEQQRRALAQSRRQRRRRRLAGAAALLGLALLAGAFGLWPRASVAASRSSPATLSAAAATFAPPQRQAAEHVIAVLARAGELPTARDATALLDDLHGALRDLLALQAPASGPFAAAAWDAGLVAARASAGWRAGGDDLEARAAAAAAALRAAGMVPAAH